MPNPNRALDPETQPVAIWRLRVASAALLLATAHAAAASTDLATLQYSPDSTVTVAGTQLADEAVADDDLAGSIGTINLGALAGNQAVDAFGEIDAATREFSLEIPATLNGIQTRPHDVIAYDGSDYSLAVDLSTHGVPRGANLVGLARNGNTVYCVFDRTVVLGGTRFEDADVAALDNASAGTFSLAFDASNAGLEAALGVDGLERLVNGNWLFSFDRDGTAGGVRFDAEDVAEYDPGAGTWSLAYDASSNFSVWERANMDALAATQQPAGDFQFAIASQTVNEGTGSVTVTVDRVNGTEGDVAVDYATSDGSAIAGSDYTAAGGTLTWVDGDGSSKQFTVSIIDDSDTEPAEDFDVDLSNPTGGASLGTPATHTVTIAESDQPSGELVFSTASQSVNEGIGSVTVTVDRINGTGGSVAVDYATVDGLANSPDDYFGTSGTLTWADGDGSSKQFTVSIVDDEIAEPAEDFDAELSDPTGGASLGTPATHTVTIAESDQPPGELVFSTASQSVNEGDGEVIITVDRNNGTSGAVSVDYATADGSADAGDDYSATSGTLTWADGDGSSKQFTVPILDDGINEGGDEDFSANLSKAGGGASVGTPGTQTVTISDNDQQMVRWTQASICLRETTGSASATMERVNGTSGAVEVDFSVNAGSATSPEDFTVDTSSPVTLSDEQASASVDITISDDSDFEDDESFELQIDTASSGATVGTPATVTVGIDEDEQPEGVVFRDGFENCPGLLGE